MQNWESMQQANYDHNWYGNMFTTIKREPSTTAYNIEHHHVSLSKGTSMDTGNYSPTSPPSKQADPLDGGHNFYDSHVYNGMNNTNHPLGFNPLTPPGYPNAIIPQINFGQDLNYPENTTVSSNPLNNTQQHVSSKLPSPKTEIPTQSLTPSHTPPMDITPPKSPKSLPATPEKDHEITSNSNDSGGEDTRFMESDNDGDDTISKPKFNSHGKVKKFKCKQCGYIAITKIDFWTHAREHIKPEKLLECHFCPFVTELKHHLEYHIRKHKNLKPFQCDQCSYSCVNKSMLNSHLKSHSKVYQYRCSDCDYATKYCHSFKLHLRKYNHKPGMVLNEDGTPNPLIQIDVYGTRRGPKMKASRIRATARAAKQESRNLPKLKSAETCAATQSRVPPLLNSQSASNMMSNLLPSTLASMLQQSRNLPFFPYLNLNLQMLAVQQQAVLAQLSPNMGNDAPNNNIHHQDDLQQIDDKISKYSSEEDDSSLDANSNSHNAMDLTQASPIKIPPSSFLEKNNNNNNNTTPCQTDLFSNSTTTGHLPTTPILTGSSKLNRRKGLAFKLDATGSTDKSEEDAEELVAVRSTKPPSSDDLKDTMKPPKTEVLNEKSTGTTAVLEKLLIKDLQNSSDSDETNGRLLPKDTYECRSCGIYFRDAVLHTIHMGYHSCDDEFKCNMCGERCGDRLTFFVHIARFPHS